MERLVVQGRVEGRRSRGRSPTRWTDLIKSATGASIVECSRIATNRLKWRQFAKAAIQLEKNEDEDLPCTTSPRPRPL